MNTTLENMAHAISDNDSLGRGMERLKSPSRNNSYFNPLKQIAKRKKESL